MSSDERTERERYLLDAVARQAKRALEWTPTWEPIQDRLRAENGRGQIMESRSGSRRQRGSGRRRLHDA